MATLSQPTKFEYRSKEEINGWPLIHINLGTRPKTGQTPVANGVVAIGNIAYGIVSIGAVAFGIVTLAGFGIGVVSLAGFAIGIVALGAIALGYKYALGAVVMAAESAIGLVSVDHPLVVWVAIFAAFIALVIWALRKTGVGHPRGQ